GRRQRLLFLTLELKAPHGSAVGLQRLVLILLGDQLRILQGLKRSRSYYLCQFLVSHDSGSIPGGHLLIQQGGQQGHTFRGAATPEAKICCGVADAIISRIFVQRSQVFFQGSFSPASLEIALGFFQSLGNVWHESSFLKRSLAEGRPSPLGGFEVTTF